MFHYISVLLSLFIFVVQGWEKKETKWPEKTPVILIQEDDFEFKTRIGEEPIEIPWFIFFYSPWCPACPRMVPIWEELTRKHSEQIFMAAINGEEAPNLVERFAVGNYPAFLYFAPNNKIYRFDGPRNGENLTDYIVHERWQQKIEEGEDIVKQVSTLKYYIRRLTHPIMIPILIVVCFVGLIYYVYVEDKKYEKAKMEEAKVVKQELIRREQVRREKEAAQQEKSRIEHPEEEKESLLKDKIE